MSKKEIKIETIASNEYMTLNAVYDTSYGYQKENQEGGIELARVTKTRTPMGWQEKTCFKFKKHYVLKFDDSFILQVKRAIGVKSTGEWSGWNYDQDKVNEYIIQHAPFDVSEYVSERYHRGELLRLYGDPNKLDQWHSSDAILYRWEDGEKVTGLSPQEKRKEKNNTTYNMIQTLFKAQIQAIEEKYGIQMWQARNDREIVMNLSWRKGGVNKLNELIKEYVENNIIKDLNNLGITGKFAGDIAVNGDLIKGIKFIDLETENEKPVDNS